MAKCMNLRLLLLILASVSLSALAQLTLKLGTGPLAAQRSGGAGRELFALATSPWVIGGLALYGFGAVLWLFVLGRTQLSLAYPFVGLGFILTMLAGALVLHEPVGFARVAGTLMIVAGCVLVARTA
jgi:drug/metabolite transporter (DMT)-like permease